ncbi:hypothetical protein IW262DRAFT_1296265 [Armillaria fumosa]|nr:hypothetical protein IW262DRAFT_1296265 [Armillaria fumosa]
MGPNGVRSLLYETHTHHFNKIQLQYLEAVFEHVRMQELHTALPPISAFFAPTWRIPDFGNFGDVQHYGGFVPSKHYLSAMLNKAIEQDEADANQHTACLEPDQLVIDNSHKVNKHIAKEDGVPIFSALWTCMSSYYIHSQALTVMKSHEE